MKYKNTLRIEEMSDFLSSITNAAVQGANKVGKFLGVSPVEGFVSQSDSTTAVVSNPAIAEILNKTKKMLLGGTEPFVSDASGTTKVNTGAIAQVSGMIFIYIFLLIAFGIVFCYGSARTSYCYNIAIGNTADVAFLFSVLCFFFPNFYYPYHALFLNPLCISKLRNNKGMFGGKK